MVYNTIYPVRQNPYVTRDGRSFVKKKEDEESSPSSSSQSQQEEPQESVQAGFQNVSNTQSDRNSNLRQEVKNSQKAQDAAMSAYNENVKNASVNVAQILKDFRSTAAAIGTPPELNEEVNSYLSLIETQVQKQEPNVKIVKSNLKNASSLLDSYITETLQRPSKVVENWIDALFLQKINYKFNSDEVNPQFLVKFPDNVKKGEVQQAQSEVTETSQIENKPNITVPSDNELKSLFLKAKKYSYADNPQKAMAVFQSALSRANDVNDSETQSKILYEIGKIYDKNDYLSQALTSYNQSLATTQDANIKVKAHYSMAQIYDDVAKFEPAINHYMSSISYAGETENFTAQSTSLTKIGNIFTDKYQKDAFDFYSEAKTIASEGKDSKVKGYVSSNLANAYDKFNEPQNALKYYSEAIKDYKDAQSPLKIAVNYQKAANVMKDYNNPQKAKSLLEKALSSAKQTDNSQLISEINAQLSSM